MQHHLVLIFSILLIGCSGCSDGLKSVSGKIDYDGKPVETGRISFITEGGAGTTYTGNCKNGRYSIRVPEGEFLVRITSVKFEKLENPVDTGVGTKITERTIHLVPDTYGMRSRLKITVDAATKTHDFLLEKPEDADMNHPFNKSGT